MMPLKIFQLVLKVLLPILVLAAATKVTMTIIESKKPVARRPSVAVKPLVETETVFAQDIPVAIEAYGTVRPAVKVVVTSQVKGKVIKLSPQLVDGGFLKKGELLLLLDPRAQVGQLRGVFTNAILEPITILGQSRTRYGDQAEQHQHSAGG